MNVNGLFIFTKAMNKVSMLCEDAACKAVC
jgi:hypothetical protein